VTDQGSLIQLGSLITGFLVSSAPGTPPDKVRSGITKLHGILGHPPPPCCLALRVIPVAPVAKEKSDPNRILRGRLSGDRPPDPPPNLHLDSHWKVGNRASQKRPGPAAPVPDGMDPAPVDHGPHCDGVPGYWGP